MNLQIELFVKEYETQLKKAAEQLRSVRMPLITEELFAMYEQNGNRLRYEAVYFERRKFLNVFAMNSILYHKREDICKLEEIITEICAEECWALPAHVNRKNNKDWRITIELFASETAQALTEISELLGETLNEKVRELIDENVSRRVLSPFYHSVVPYDKWEGCDMNWCAVCAGCIGIISIYRFQKDPAFLEKCLDRINHALVGYISGFSSDGVCAEGLDYWTYGMYYYVSYARKLKEYTNGRVNLLEGEKLQNILTFQQKCYFLDGTSISFSDGSQHSRFRMGLTAFLTGNDNEVHFPDMKNVMRFGEDECNRWAPAYRDYAWTKEYLEKFSTLDHQRQGTRKICEGNRNSQPACYAFNDAQWLICNGKHSGIAIKGGHNEESHNHNDVGNFLYIYQEVEFLVDLGAGEYCRDYFNENRYSIFCNNAESHNVPMVNGKLQNTGRQYCCSSFETDLAGCAALEFSKAYESGLLESLQRQIWFDGMQDELHISDTFVLSENTQCIQENLVTRQTVVVEGNICKLEENGVCCKIIVDLPEKDDVFIEVIDKVHDNHAGQRETIHLIRWTVFQVQNRVQSEKKVVCTFRIVPM